MLMSSVRPPAPAIAVLLIGTLLFPSPRTVTAQSEEYRRALAIADTDAIKHKALQRLATEGTHISAVRQKQFEQDMRRVIEEQLARLRLRYDAASARLEAQIGYLTPLDILWTSLWNSAEEAQRVLQDKIDAAMVQANVRDGQEEMNTLLGAALLDHAMALYAQSRQTFNDILYDTMLKEQVLGPLTKDLVKELIQLVDIASPALAIQKDQVDPQAAAVFSETTQTTVIAILGAQIAQALGLRLGIGALSRGALGSVLQVITGPAGTVVLLASTLVDIYRSKYKTISACKEALWKTYQATYRAYTGPVLANLTAATIAGLEQQLQTDREATRVELDRFFDGILIQAQSPGFLAFIESRDSTEAVKAVKRVADVFQRELIDIPFAQKYALASDIEPNRATEMIRMHGRTFLDLYTRQPQALVQVMPHTRFRQVVLDIVQSHDPNTGLLFYKQSLDRFGALDSKQMDALILIRQLLPTKRPDDLSKVALTVLGDVVDRLQAVKQQTPTEAATIIEWVLHGQISGTTLQRLAAHSQAALLFALPIHLGPDLFTQALQAADETILLQFVRDFTTPAIPLPQSQAVLLLREDGPGYLRMYCSTGGPRAVQARHRLFHDYSGRFTPETENTLRWLVTYASLNPQAISRSTIDNVQTLGLAHWPHLLALPMANLVVSTGLTGPLAIVVIIVLLPLGLLWFRVVRLTLPARRRHLASRTPDTEVLPVRPMQDIRPAAASMSTHAFAAEIQETSSGIIDFRQVQQLREEARRSEITTDQQRNTP
jgi:hypothetical protein